MRELIYHLPFTVILIVGILLAVGELASYYDYKNTHVSSPIVKEHIITFIDKCSTDRNNFYIIQVKNQKYMIVSNSFGGISIEKLELE